MIPQLFHAPTNGEQQPSGPPEYKVYRPAGPLLAACASPISPSLRERGGERAEAARRTASRSASAAAAAERRARAASGSSSGSGSPPLGWILLSFLAFAVSAQLQAFKLSGEAKDALHGNPFLLPSAQTILVLGTDARPPDTKEPGAAPSEECFEQQAHGDAPHGGCSKRANSAPTP